MSYSTTGMQPLAPTRQLPPTPTLKRPNMHISDVEKRARQRVMLTPPHSSSDGHAPSDDVDVQIGVEFKVPALPVHGHGRMRMMTPSTSTVAASSSPARLSSPPMSTSKARARASSGFVESSIDEAIEVNIQRGITYVFGRHRHHDSHTSSSTTLPPDIAASLSNASAPTKTIFLPRAAIQSSRLHAVVEYLNESDKLRIIVSGQNGIKVKSGRTKRRMAKGQSIDIERERTVKLSFYKCKAILRLPESRRSPVNMEDEELEQVLGAESSPMREPLSSLPPSSPPAGFDDLMDEDEDDVEEEEARQDLNRSSSPLSSVSEDGEDSFSHTIKAEALEEHEAPSPVIHFRPIEQRPISRAPSPVKEEKVIPPIPADVDLPALIASTVVFSGSSKLSLPDLVKHMLESQPNFRTLAPEDIWNAWVGAEVNSNPMFGKVSRVGKDSSGHPLLSHYFYSPDHDPDAVRAQELGGLVRPLRNVQRAGGKAIDWRPVGSGRRRY